MAVTLNVTVEVLFVPHTRKTEQNWPPILPEDTGTIRTPEEARLVPLGLADYAVTPDAERAGRVELLHYPGGDDPEFGTFPPSQSIIFYTTQEEFETLWDETLLVSTRSPSFRSGVSSSEFAGMALMDFLLGRIIASPHFKPRHKQILGR